MSKQFLGVIAAIILVFVGVAALSGNKSNDNKSSSAAKGTPTNHVVGKGTAGVTLVEYGDFQCPYCGAYHPVLKQVKAEFGDQIKFQFRHFPLQGLHPNAFAAARAAEAAAQQGKFWEMHDVLFENQAEWSSSKTPTVIFETYAKRLGLNADQFKQDFASDQVNSNVNADMAEGNKLKLTGTPSFLINGKKVDIGQSVSEFEKVIKAEIAKQNP